MDTRDIFYVIKSKGYFKYVWKLFLLSDSNYSGDKYTKKKSHNISLQYLDSRYYGSTEIRKEVCCK